MERGRADRRRTSFSDSLPLSDHFYFALILTPFVFTRCLLTAKPSHLPSSLSLHIFFSFTPPHWRLQWLGPLHTEQIIILGNFNIHTDEPTNILASNVLYPTTLKTFIPILLGHLSARALLWTLSSLHLRNNIRKSPMPPTSLCLTFSLPFSHYRCSSNPAQPPAPPPPS